MKITREQVKKWNGQAKGGFNLDIEYLLTRNEKTLVKYIKITEKVTIEFRLWYMEEIERRTNEHGCSWNVPTGRQIPTLTINLLRTTTTDGVYTSVPIKWRITQGEPEKTKKYSTLCKISEEYDAEQFAAEWAAANLENVDNIPTYYKVI